MEPFQQKDHIEVDTRASPEAPLSTPNKLTDSPVFGGYTAELRGAHTTEQTDGVTASTTSSNRPLAIATNGDSVASFLSETAHSATATSTTIPGIIFAVLAVVALMLLALILCIRRSKYKIRGEERSTQAVGMVVALTRGKNGES
jgi:beta-lactamase regulating signal transducer with metallopeptidase domain